MSRIEELSTIQNQQPGYKHHWVYLDNGLPVMSVARYDEGHKKTYRQFHRENEKWVIGMPPSPYPLFGLHSLKSPSIFDSLLISEGEKCATVLHQLGWPAISPSLGAQSPEKSDWNPCRYYTRFIILRDNDKAGITFAQKVAAAIRRIQPNSAILVVNLTPNVNGGDLIDWLQYTILRGQSWNGFDSLPLDKIESIRTALTQEIRELQIACEECPHVSFKPVEALFEGDPKPFQVQLPPVPPFPLEIFPEKVRYYISAIAEQFSQASDYVATAFIASVGGMIGRTIHLKMRALDSWEETANCWCILVGAPSAKKSPILRRIFNLFKPLDKRAAESFAAAIKGYKSRKKAAEEAKDEFDESPPVRRRYVTDDITTPKLRELMAGNPKGIILRNDELKGQLERLDKNGSEGDRAFMMSCWSGLEDYSEDRMCRESLLNIPLALTWIGCIPPAPLQRYLCEAMGRNGGADGFMQRFQFVCFPDQRTAFVLSEKAVPGSLENDIQQLMELMDEQKCNQPRLLFFNDEAQRYFDEWLIKHENNARFGNHPLYWESHLGKQAKALAVLTIILHRLDEAISGNFEDRISLATLKAALQAQTYYLAHARRCYDSVAGGSVSDAEIILSLIRQKRLPSRFKAQDIYHQGLGGLSDSFRVRAALDLLHAYGWVVCEKINGPTGRSSEFWIVHPNIM